MAASLLLAMGELKLKTDQGHLQTNDANNPFNADGPRKRRIDSTQVLREDLIQNFLGLPKTFSPEWLNKLQQ